MSHIDEIALIIKDLAALKAAVAELGGVWRGGKRTYNWYGRSMGDYPAPEGVPVSELGKCDHAIGLPGVTYEIGVVQKGDRVRLLFDFFGYDGSGHDGHKLRAHFGDKLTRLSQMYSVHKATREAEALGHSVIRESQPNGVIRLQITGRAI
jgi:hypothetical protein